VNVLEQVRKLLALGGDRSTTDGERASACAAAGALIVKHKLSVVAMPPAPSQERVRRAERVIEAALANVTPVEMIGQWATYTAISPVPCSACGQVVHEGQVFGTSPGVGGQVRCARCIVSTMQRPHVHHPRNRPTR
jgi:hypothetical protein